MDHYEPHLEMAQRHVEEGEARVAKQTALVAELEDKGLETAQAEALLATMKESLALAYVGLARERERAGL